MVTEALAEKVDGSVFTEYQGEVEEALDGKVATGTFTEYQGVVTEALATKATTEALNTLEGKVNVDIQNLTNHLTDYSNMIVEVDGRIDALESFVGEHVNHEAILESDIEGLFTQSND